MSPSTSTPTTSSSSLSEIPYLPSWLVPELDGYDNQDNNNNSNNEMQAATLYAQLGNQLDLLRLFSTPVSDGNNEQAQDQNNNEPTNSTSTTTTTIGICNLISLSPFVIQQSSSTPIMSNYDELQLYPSGYEGAFATVLAMQHLNNGDGSIVPQVAGLNETCNIRFVPEFIETMALTDFAVSQVIQRLSEETLQQNVIDPNMETYIVNRPTPCSFIGGWESSVSQHTSVITSLQQYSQVSGISTNSDLDNEQEFPKFARTVPSGGGEAEAFIKFLMQDPTLQPVISESPYLAILNIDNDWSSTYATRVRQAASIWAPNLIVEQVLVDPFDTQAIANAITTTRELNFPIILGIFIGTTNDIIDGVMIEAYNQQLAGHGEFAWYFAGDLAYTIFGGRPFELGSPLQLAFEGTGLINIGGGYPGNNQYTKFENALKEMAGNEDVVLYMKSILPMYGESQESDFVSGEVTDTYDDQFIPFNSSALLLNETFLNPLQDSRVQFLYEATVLMGLAACGAVSEVDDLFLNGDAFFSQILNTTFQGISGEVILNPQTGSRIPNSTSYLMTNANAVTSNERSVNDKENTVVFFNDSLTNVFLDGQWKQLQPFYFNNNSTTFTFFNKWALANTVEVNTGIRVVALIFCGLAILLALFCAGYTYTHRKTRIIRASQPFFLYAICFGTIVLASAIIPISFDKQMMPLDSLGIACTSMAWLLYLGLAIIFSMLFSKTYRINTIMRNSKRFKKINVKLRDTLLPSLILILLNIVVLSVMTAIDPIDFEFFILETDRFGRAKKIYGRCGVEGHGEYFITLTILNFGILLLALIQAWQVRHLSTEYQESESLLRALIIIVLAAFIGVPVMILARASPDSSLFIASALVFITCCAILLLIFVPKYRYEKRHQTSSVTVTGLNPPSNGMNGSGSGGLQEQCADSCLSSSDLGDVILFNKTRRELADEVTMLRKRLREIESNSGETSSNKSDFKV